MQGVAQIRILGQRGPDWASQTLRGYVGLKVYVYGNFLFMNRKAHGSS